MLLSPQVNVLLVGNVVTGNNIVSMVLSLHLILILFPIMVAHQVDLADSQRVGLPTQEAYCAS